MQPWPTWTAGCCRCLPPTSGPRDGRFVVHHVWSLPRLETFLCVSAPVDPAEPSFPVDRRPASRRELVRAGSDGLLRSRARGTIPTPSGWPSTTTGPRVRGRCGRTFDADTRVPRVDGRLPSVSAGHRRRCVPGSGGARSRGHHRARSFPFRCRRGAGALSAAQAVLRPQGDRKALRAAAVAAHAVPGGVDLRGHGRGPRPRVQPRHRAAGRRRGAARARRHCAWSCSNSSACTTTSPTSAHSRPTSPSPSRRAARRPNAKVSCGCTSVCSARGCCAGTIAFGGVKHDLTPDGSDALRRHLRTLETEFDSLITLLIDSGSFTDRVDTHGHPEQSGGARPRDRRHGRPRLGHRRRPPPRPPARCLRGAAVRGPG